MKFKKTLLAATAALTLASTAAYADIVIAVAGPMTGQYAALGEQMKRGADQAVADLNAAGGILGEKIKLEVGDDACDPKQAVAVANQLAGAGVIFVSGHYCSSSSIPASQVYSEEGILQISPASTNPKLTDEAKGNNVFRICGRDDQQGLVAGQYIATTYKGKNVAVIHDKTAYGKGLADETQKSMNAAGLKEKLYEAYTPGERDYSALVSKLKQSSIDVLYIGGYHTEAGLIARQLKDQGMTVQIISGDALVTEEFWTITGPAGQGTLMTFGPEARNKPGAKAVVDKFRAQGFEPEGYTLYTYATLQVFKQAVEKAGSKDLDKVTAAMRSTEFDTVMGKIAFDQKGDVTTPAYVFYKWNNGKYAEVTAN
jgi:branched-chain amino acid transport system substrate-binding protein